MCVISPDESSVQVPLELESPTQISLVDEASGEVLGTHRFESGSVSNLKLLKVRHVAVDATCHPYV